MTAPVDLTAVKAMLFDALVSATDYGSDYFGHDAAGNIVANHDDMTWGAQPIDADKLAATVVDWFAAHYEQSSGEKMLAMIRQGQDGVE